MRTRKQLEEARLPKIGMVRAKYSQGSNNPLDNFAQGDLIPAETEKGETIESQILEVLLDIRDILK